MAALVLMGGACTTSSPARRQEAERPSPPPILLEPGPPEAAEPFADVPPRSDADPATVMRVHALDVGQGSATLLELPCGVVLVDVGGEVNGAFDATAALIAQLDAFFARRADLHRTIDLLVVTHPHIDHVRGLPAVLSRYKVRNVVDNGQSGDKLVEEYLQALQSWDDAGEGGRRSIATEAVGPGGTTDAVIDPLACSPVDPVIRVLAGRMEADPGWGSNKYDKRHFDNENNHSVVLRIDFGRASVLITGDTEERALDDLVRRYEGTQLLDVDVYVVGHHGSHNGTTRALLDAMTPKVAVMSMGPASRHESWSAWRYGHPRAHVYELLSAARLMRRTRTERLVAAGVKSFHAVAVEKAIYGTGWDGPVVVEVYADGFIRVEAMGRAEALSN